MGHGRRLRRLRMRVRGENRLAMTRRELDERLAQIEHRARERRDELPLPYPEHRHVDVVAAARDAKTPGDILAARLHERSFDVVEEVLARLVVAGGLDVGERNGVERFAQRVRVPGADDALLPEHDEMRVVDGDEWREKERLRVLEVLAQDPRDVFRIEARHRTSAAACRSRTDLCRAATPWTARWRTSRGCA